MVTGHCYAHDLAYNDFAIPYDGLGRNRTHCENRTLRRIDYGRKLVNAEHTEIADRKCGAHVLFGSEFSCAGALRQFTDLRGDLANGLAISRTHDRGDQSILNCDSHADVCVFIMPDVLVLKRGVNLRMLNQGIRRNFDNEIVEADLEVRIQLIDLRSEF